LLSFGGRAVDLGGRVEPVIEFIGSGTPCRTLPSSPFCLVRVEAEPVLYAMNNFFRFLKVKEGEHGLYVPMDWIIGSTLPP